MGMEIFSGAFPSNSFPWLLLSFQTLHFLLFSFQGVWPGHQPSAGESQEHWAVSWGLNLCHKPIQLLWGGSAVGTESGSEDRVAWRIEWEVWRSFKAPFSSLSPFPNGFLVLKKFLWDAAVRNLSPFPPYFHCSLCRWQAIFSYLLRLSFPIPITGFNLLCPFLLSILFFFILRREKKGALASQLFICKYFLYFCPDLAKVRVLKEWARESLLFPSGILAASFLASKAVYKTNGKQTFFYACCKICFIIMYPILKCMCGLNPPNM